MPDTSRRVLGPRGAALIKGKETLRLEVYLPTRDDVPTVGWGHTRGVELGDKITVKQAEQFFAEDTAGAVAAVNRLGVPLSQSMFDALVSLVFNAGEGTIGATSTIGKALRERRYFDAWAGFVLWRKQKGKDLRGLAARRAEEMVLFMQDPLP